MQNERSDIMGIIENWHCPTCGYEKELSIGSGFMGCNLGIIEELFSEEKLDLFLKLLEEEKISTYVMQQDVVFCNDCKDFESVTSLHYTTQDEKETIVRNGCPKCGGNSFELKSTEYCPKCNDKLQKDESGLWD